MTANGRQIENIAISNTSFIILLQFKIKNILIFFAVKIKA